MITFNNIKTTGHGVKWDRKLCPINSKKRKLHIHYSHMETHTVDGVQCVTMRGMLINKFPYNLNVPTVFNFICVYITEVILR